MPEPARAAATPVGAPGTAAGTKLFEAVDGALDPRAFCAVTVHVYVLPFVRPGTTIGLDVPVCEPITPPSLEVHDAVYPVIAVPPSLAGAEKETVPDVFPRTAVPIVGAPGTVVAAVVALTRTDVTRGVTESSVVLSDARYCRYRPLGLLIVEPATFDQADHVAPSSDVRVAN
jgi:hypothetical protein